LAVIGRLGEGVFRTSSTIQSDGEYQGISREGGPDQSNLPGFAKFNEALSDREPSKGEATNPRPGGDRIGDTLAIPASQTIKVYELRVADVVPRM